jgi:protein-disulfide isomerase
VAALQKVLAKWGDSVRFVYVNFPLESHKNAFKAAEASLCAADQGRFWDYHDRLFEAGDLGAPGQYGAIAESLGLNQRTFAECLESNTKKALVDEQLERGLKAGVDVTPTFFINGQVVRGAAPFAEFDLAIQQLLGKTKGP